MKKIIIVAVVAIVLVVGYFGISSVVVSKMVEKNFSTVTANVAKKSNIELKDVDYQASFTGATAYTTVHLYGQPQDAQFKIKHEISTIPFYTKTDGSSGLAATYIKSTLTEDNFPPDVLDNIKTAFNNQSPVTLETVVDYSGNYHLTITVNPAALEEDQKTFKFSGMHGDFLVSKDGGQLTGKAQFQTLAMNSGGGAMQMENFEANVNQAQNSAGLWIGKSDMKIGHVNAQTPMGEFNVNQVSMEANTADQVKTLEYLMKFAVKEITSPEGFPLAVNSVDYQFKVDNVDSSAAATLLQNLEDMQHKMQTNTPAESQQLMQQFSAQSSPSIEQLLRGNPHLTQNLAVATAQGPVTMDMDVSFSGFPADQTIAGLQSPAQLIQYVSGTLNAKSPMAILQMTPFGPQIAAYQQQGMLKVEGDTAIINAVLKDSQLMLNDQPIPLQF
jgi:uncharacterized protein YdgA (DUF945 family)